MGERETEVLRSRANGDVQGGGRGKWSRSSEKESHHDFVKKSLLKIEQQLEAVDKAIR